MGPPRKYFWEMFVLRSYINLLPVWDLYWQKIGCYELAKAYFKCYIRTKYFIINIEEKFRKGELCTLL